MSGAPSRRGFLRELASAAREVRQVGGGVRGQDPAPQPESEAELEAPRPRAEDALSDSELDRYSRQLVLPRWTGSVQLGLREASALVVGAGALGSPVALYLAGAGIGRLGIVDPDRVELSNLHRQPLHYTPDLGVAKAHSAAAKLGFLNPEVEVVPYEVRVDAGSAAGLLAGHDLVVDCSDSFETRYAVNAACCDARIDLVEGGVVGGDGLVMAIRPHRSACYRCAFPEPPPPGARATCAEAGVLGPAAGVIGSLQALEGLKLLTGFAPALTGGFLQVDLLGAQVTRVAVERRADCPDCGVH